MSEPTAALAEHRTGPLGPIETAQASVMAGLTAAIAVVATIVPPAHLLSIAGVVPMALLGYRYRLRALCAATFAGTAIGFFAAGLTCALTVAHCAYIGGLTGMVKRRGRGRPTLLATMALAGAISGLFAVAALMVLSDIRELVLTAVAGNLEGWARILRWAGPFQATADGLQDSLAAVLRHWPLLVIGYAVFIVLALSVLAWWALTAILRRSAGLADVHQLDVSPQGVAGPVPVSLRDVSFRHPGSDREALRPISVEIGAGEHVAVIGENGSGKTTLMLLLAGRSPTSGTVHRPGSVALGRTRGTAVILQHPETQVLGVRAGEDVRWGLPPEVHIDVDRLLTDVGLAGMADRGTDGMSGGELQRLAIAGALARDPSLLIADEVTSMVDPAGREALVDLLSTLPKRCATNPPVSVVQITHYDGEAAAADRIINLSESADNSSGPRTLPTPATQPGRTAGTALVEFDRVGYHYAAGTPWAQTALRDISFTLDEGEGVLIHGGNGSGKSTLAWLMAGLMAPTSGRCSVAGRPATERDGDVAMAFQAARLQLLRPRVGLDIAAAGGFSPDDRAKLTSALETVGLDPALADRRIDQLSGGQLRRVALAGLLARSPRLLILDEPLAGLDAANHRGLVKLLERLRRDQGMTVVVISHDFDGLHEVCPRILHLDGGLLATTIPVQGT